MVSSLPLAACIGASAIFAGAAAGLPVEDCATGFNAGFAEGFCAALDGAAVLLDF